MILVKWLTKACPSNIEACPLLSCDTGKNKETGERSNRHTGKGNPMCLFRKCKDRMEKYVCQNVKSDWSH